MKRTQQDIHRLVIKSQKNENIQLVTQKMFTEYQEEQSLELMQLRERIESIQHNLSYGDEDQSVELCENVPNLDLDYTNEKFSKTFKVGSKVAETSFQVGCQIDETSEKE